LKGFKYIQKIVNQIEGQWAKSTRGPPRGLPAQCWHDPACVAHTARNCSSSNPWLSGPAAHDRVACTLGGAVTSPTQEGDRLRARSGGARLERRGGRGGGAYRCGVGQGGGADGVDGVLQLGWRRRGGSLTCAEDGGGESGGEKDCGGSRRRLAAGTAARSSSGGGM
jgi:hypothetical protein